MVSQCSDAPQIGWPSECLTEGNIWTYDELELCWPADNTETFSEILWMRTIFSQIFECSSCNENLGNSLPLFGLPQKSSLQNILSYQWSHWFLASVTLRSEFADKF